MIVAEPGELSDPSYREESKSPYYRVKFDDLGSMTTVEVESYLRWFDGYMARHHGVPEGIADLYKRVGTYLRFRRLRDAKEVTERGESE